MEKNFIIQITSGQGPAECEWVVARLLKILMQDAQSKSLQAEVIDRQPGSEPNTLSSTTLSIQGLKASEFVSEWSGSVLWIGKSMYRKFHKRKNWFVGVNVFDPIQSNSIDEKLIEYTTMRASGPGGQHVNKTETAVRATYKSLNLAVVASDSRSQMQNKKLALERLKILVSLKNQQNSVEKAEKEWNKHRSLERGNPIKTFEGIEFTLKKEK